MLKRFIFPLFLLTVVVSLVGTSYAIVAPAAPSGPSVRPPVAYKQIIRPAGPLVFQAEWGGYIRNNQHVNFDTPSDMSLQAGRLYILDPVNHSVAILSVDGTAHGAITSDQIGGSSAGVAADNSGRLYVANASYAITRAFRVTGVLATQFGSNGQIGSEGQGLGDENRGWGKTTTDSNDEVYICDPNNTKVKKFFKNGAFAGEIGGPNQLTVRLTSAKDVVYSGAGGEYIYIASGQSIRKISTAFDSNAVNNSTDFVTGLEFCNLITARGNYIFIMDNNIIKKLNMSGQVVWTYNGQGDGEGMYSDPAAIEVDKDGNVYVLDKGQNKVIKYTQAQ
ncbi:MAG: hypothetical protein ABIJ26_01350 [Candidatus Margulisiibacteriota bacterium]